MQSDQEYCCYCMEPKYDKWGCCGENHFLTFKDFDEQTQKEFIEAELEEYETWSKTQ